MNQIRGQRDRHPSGKPIRRDKKTGWQDGYRVQDGPRLPSLQRDRHNIEAIGFTANLVQEDEE